MKCPTCDVNLIVDAQPGGRILCCPECCREWTPSRWDEAVAAQTGPELPWRADLPRPWPRVTGESRQDLFNWF